MSTVKIQVDGVVGEIILDNPKALNSLTHDDIRAIRSGLGTHEANPAVKAIVIRSSSEKAFCAGGDMKQIYRYITTSQFDAIHDFFVDEYALNLAISRCTKPYVALMHGITMGGGMGVSVHGRFRVVTETSLLAMPESRIGFFPDVGGSYFLPRLPQRAGYWIGLTAATVRGAEALDLNLATHCIDSKDVHSVIDRLNTTLGGAASVTGQTAHDLVQQTLDELATSQSSNTNDTGFKKTLDQRAEWFADDNAQLIEQRLSTSANEGNQDAKHLLDLLTAGSPQSTKITLDLFNRAKDKTLEQCLELELALCKEAVQHSDCREGVRAVLIDKDKSPAWQTV